MRDDVTDALLKMEASLAGPLDLPQRINLYGFDDFTDDQGSRLFAYLTESDYLKVRNEQESLWESTDRFDWQPVNEDGRIIALKWNGLVMQETWRTSAQDGYIADFALADIDNDGAKEVAAYTQFQHKSVFSKPRSALVLYELN